MAITHNLGFPRIGAQRELKFALENYWKGSITASELAASASDLRQYHWHNQTELDWVPVGDFSLYDQVLDMSITLGHIPERVRSLPGGELDNYFRIARGRAPSDLNKAGVAAGEMTKWFDTNYHYIVPEFDANTEFKLNSTRLLTELAEAKQAGVHYKPVIIGPVTYLWLGKVKDQSDKLQLLERLLPAYQQLLDTLAQQGAEWVQIDEPALVTELDAPWQQAYIKAYQYLQRSDLKLLLTTYFGTLGDNLSLACRLPVQGIHLDAVRGRDDINNLVKNLADDKIISLGVIDGRNIWKSNLNDLLDWLEPLHQQLGERLWLAPSCSLLHVPVDLNSETDLDPEIKNWLAFAKQKLSELTTVADALNNGRGSVADTLKSNAAAHACRYQSERVNNPTVKATLQEVNPTWSERHSPYAERVKLQREKLPLPNYPTTTIGSFPQTGNIRKYRSDYRQGVLKQAEYRDYMHREIKYCINEQETLGLDVLVHGEAERNDMVEYFGELLAGFIFTRFGWVQSYGSRCVKPPVIYGDIQRPEEMTLEWIRYAQSLTDKPVKGMLTGPVTILNWSFVRDDQPRSTTCLQLAVAIRDEVLDLERAGVQIIQIDEAALREGLPLKKSQWPVYLQWAVDAFRVTANGVADATQIHTHMCYSEFNDIIEAIARMDADVITIETSRSDMELLDVFDHFRYPNEIGPGVYDIHSPNIPTQSQIIALMEKASQRIPVERLWVNPDCGLKTRSWEEVLPALRNMVAAAHYLRENIRQSS